MRKVAEAAGHVGFAMEPDPRAASAAAAAATPFVLWRARSVEAPDSKLYGPVATVMKLAMAIACADGDAHSQEIVKVTEMVETLFVLDAATRERLEALRDILIRHPVKITGLTRRLAESRAPEQLATIGRLLVAIAGADGVITPEEHKVLRSIYRGLDLPAAALDGVLATFHLAVDSDRPVVVGQEAAPRRGSRVRAPDDPGKHVGIKLDQAAIQAILADTREVAAILAEVLEGDDADEGEGGSPQPGRNAKVSPSTARPADDIAATLGDPYRSILAELVTRTEWSRVEIHELAGRYNAMSGAVLETLNTWADETLGDHLILEGETWIVRTELVARQQP